MKLKFVRNIKTLKMLERGFVWFTSYIIILLSRKFDVNIQKLNIC